MKSSLMRPAMVVALALGLASCGGKAGFTVSGMVSGLQYAGLVLTTNGMDLAVSPPVAPATASAFSFPNQIQYGDVYDVQVKAQPQHQTCVPYGVSNSDTAGRLPQINAIFTCALNAYPVGGIITGLTADGLVLANGSTGGSITVTKNAGTFTMPLQVPYGTTYGITIQAQPTGLVCSVGPAGTGVMGDAPVGNVVIACVAKT